MPRWLKPLNGQVLLDRPDEALTERLSLVDLGALVRFSLEFARRDRVEHSTRTRRKNWAAAIAAVGHPGLHDQLRAFARQNKMPAEAVRVAAHESKAAARRLRRVLG